jgi:hypothetical protein
VHGGITYVGEHLFFPLGKPGTGSVLCPALSTLDKAKESAKGEEIDGLLKKRLSGLALMFGGIRSG